MRWGIFFNAGQVCSAMSRLIVHNDVHDEVVGRVADMARSISVGPGVDRPDFGANMGAMISAAQRDRAEAMCRAAERQGARAVAGGRKLNQPGHFLEPTIFDGVKPEMTIAREEVFGPVLSVMRFNDDDEAVRIANGTEYGLVAGIFTADVTRAMKAAARLRAGQVFINEWFAGGVETPFGGYGSPATGGKKAARRSGIRVQTKNAAIALQS